ncbi:heat shock protein Hsp20 [Chryseobacterium indoltheticum]|jgi:HSP20 family protein|uniref:Heat shock protein Hsp20 n=2 Tax=Chryseobacterium indoltheticum TaxID=254 RepID=A0A381FF04_9FLAO|nr:Hsp20/alpha crystallin family protein [Chryseobacterium indoltheticum]SIQ01249.1 heat shock protein Hsp20 [Chryseobacterium indoltheticum]SUX44343.1 Spore protein SP21 [Chryseobacterium indoltheticum]SUX45074.1 Spore protein SP21 [Chryseobacterium indoltheticum]
MTTIVKRTNGSLLPASQRSMFDDFFNRELFNWGNNNFSASRTTLPSVNIKELEKAFEVEVAAPGMKKEDFSITLDGNMLTISSSKEDQQEEKDGKYTRREFSYQSFQRSFELSKDVVDDENIQARYENGVLRLTIPKKESALAQSPRLIEIQ